MDKTQFAKYLEIVKNMMDHGANYEHLLHRFDFYKYYHEIAPQIFKDIPRDQLMTPSFKMQIWSNFCQALAMVDLNQPKVEGNVVDFAEAKTKLRA